MPHFTSWTNDYTNAGVIKSFHLSWNYNKQKHKPIHIHYTVSGTGKVKWKSTDCNRTGGDADNAKAQVNNNAADLDALAQALIDGIFSVNG
ncbi:hypothetical protein IP88_12150 [alpha proteobacterium AAP81b]|nr:hypothetical protein IP88_12150 [alpha proteobacterium AAP81b]